MAETPQISNPIGSVQDIYSKYDESFLFLQNRKQRQVSQLILLNNLQKGDENIASTLLVTLLNRICANLYDDKMQTKFVPGQEMDNKRVMELNILAQSDYRDMGKDMIDYDWVWDTLFFGRGYVETEYFDTKRKILKPEVINPLVFGYDPYFEKKEQWRYYWYWMAKSKWEIQHLIDAGEITGISKPEEISDGMDPYLWNYKIRRDQARKAIATATESYSADVYQILNFKGYDENGKKCCFWVDKDFTKILYKKELDLNDGEYEGDSKWPIVIKEAFREPHASVPFSVADLLDDKHRAKSVLMNLAFIAAKDKANPIYLYNPDKVKDVSQLLSRQISQHIPVESLTDAIAPMSKENPMDPGLVAFIQFISQEASDPLGTGISMNPQKKGMQTATESAINQQLNDLAQSLQSKVMQFGEKEFWTDWYHRYVRYSKEGDIKVATITGVKGATFHNIDLGDIHMKFPPGVLIFSAKDAEYKELVLRRDMMELLPVLATSLTPDGLRNFYKYSFFPKFLNDPTLIDNLFPKTIDEIKAEEENELLGTDELAQVAETDNHEQHLIIHQMAKKTWATWIHMDWHENLLAEQKKMQQMMAQAQVGGPMGQQQGVAQNALGTTPPAGAPQPGNPAQPSPTKQQKNPMQATAPMNNETRPNSNLSANQSMQ